MEYKVFGDTVALRPEVGEEITESIKSVCIKEGITAGIVSGIGATNHATVGLYSVAEKKYYPNVFERDMEITSLTGNVSVMNGECYLHLHITLADISGSVFGGHLNEAVISATAEIFITRLDGKIERELNKDIGLNLMKFQ